MSDTKTAEIIATLTEAQKASITEAIEYIHAVYKAPGNIVGVDFDKIRVTVEHFNNGDRDQTSRIFKLREGRKVPGTAVVYYAGKERVCAPLDGSPIRQESPESTTPVEHAAKPERFRMSSKAEKACAAVAAI